MNRMPILQRLAVAAISIFLIVYVAHQAYLHYYNPYKTEVALLYTWQNNVRVKGIFARDESIVNANNESGVRNYLYKDGTKVRKGAAVVEIYENGNALTLLDKKSELLKERDMLLRSQDAGANYYAQADVLNRSINEMIGRLSDSADKGNVSAKDGIADELVTLFNRRQITTGKEENYNDRILEIEKEIDSIGTGTTTPSARFYADRAGFFVSGIDGFERILNADTIDSVTFSEIGDYLSQKTVRESGYDVVGKIVETDKLNFLVKIPTEQLYLFDGDGMFVTISFLLSEMTTVPAKLEWIKTENGSDFAIANFSCSYMSGELSFVRTAVADINLHLYEGLKVSRSAIRYEEDLPGVFIEEASDIRFRRLDIIFEGDGFILSATKPDSDGEYLKLYDKIIMDGRNLIGKSE